VFVISGGYTSGFSLFSYMFAELVCLFGKGTISSTSYFIKNGTLLFNLGLTILILAFPLGTGTICFIPQIPLLIALKSLNPVLKTVIPFAINCDCSIFFLLNLVD